MARTYWLLAETPTGYRLERGGAEGIISDVAVPRGADPGEIAAAVLQSLREHGYRREPMVVAVASQTALAATIPHTGRSMARTHQAMAYALEEFLPVTAEEMVCDFIVFDQDALGVAVEVSALHPLLSALERLGIPIVSIVPATLLALQHRIAGSRGQGHQIAIWQQRDTLDLFELVDGKPHAWRTIPASRETLIREIKLFQLASDSSDIDELLVWNLSDELLKALRLAADGIQVTADGQPLQSSVVEACAAVVSGHQKPWIELRRGGFGKYDPHRPIRGGLRFFAAAAACALLLLSAAAWIRAEKHARLAQAYQRPQEEIFGRLFPGKSVPVGIRSRLESECRKLAGTTGRLEGTPRLESSTLLLRDALTPLPEDLRYRLLEIRLEENRVYLDGEVRRHGDADLLAAALRNGGFRVDAPHTEQLTDKGVAVTITATRSSSEDVTQKESGSP